ncbi:heavy-metal-associated domain-containing protein [Pseudomonas sp. R5(2019)]|uniref:heavy-metal-associated domain-containing protein n=1 Tax=Pseudomonas sp. R5(2019) TaxID=2697566 RepID=UPI0014137586|nr:heavy metal-associated domain-containing protein [Pseudomonas sp. R5(2019)]NBA95223.1 cation transporter [Pseudomonas sp. R5(2019)]
MKSLTMKVEGMRCESCAEMIRSRMATQTGVQAADVSFDEGRARVLYDPQATDEDRLVETVQKLGFRVVDHVAS